MLIQPALVDRQVQRGQTVPPPRREVGVCPMLQQYLNDIDSGLGNGLGQRGKLGAIIGIRVSPGLEQQLQIAGVAGDCGQV